MKLSSSGNLGLGVTPSTWQDAKAIQVGSTAAPYLALFQQTTSTSDGYLGWNARLTGDRTFAYITTGDAVSLYRLNAGNHVWFNAPSGTAGNTITFTQAMTLFSTGNLLVGTPSPISDNGARLQVNGEGRFTNSDGSDLIRYDAVGVNTNFATKIVSGANDVLVFRRQHISSGALDIMSLGFNGNVGIGTIIPVAKFEVNGIGPGLGPGINIPIILISGASGFQSIGFRRDADTNGGWFIGTSHSVVGDFGIYQNQGASAPSNRLSISTSGNVGIGTNSPLTNLQVGNGTQTAINGAPNKIHIATNSTRSALLTLANSNGGTTVEGQFESSAETGDLRVIIGSTSNHPVVFRTNNTEKMRITSAGYVYIGEGFNAVNHRINLGVNQGGGILVISAYAASPPGSTNDTAIFYSSNGANPNAAATALGVTTNSSTGRSINAGGTINASGADYAEYMTKAVEDNIAKGDIVGIDSNGTVTNIFVNSISFAVKSTDPSYVGGDVWGNAVGKRPSKTTDQTEEEFAPILAEFEVKLEIARSKVDRISFSGQVPCNVTGANVGDYIIPIELENGKIGGQAVTTPTFQQYQISVGKVWKIMEDGRAWIAVKIG
jgi:hypothetical protein